MRSSFPFPFSPRRHLLLGAALLLSLFAPGCRREPPPEATSVGPDGQVIRAQARGQSATGHLVLGGAYKADAAATAFCALNADKAFQVSFNVPGKPQVVLRIEGFKVAGQFEGETRIRANYSGENVHQSRGKARVTVEVSAASSGSLVSGSFSGDYDGEAGKGTVSGSFERCPYVLTDTAL